jgi:Protein of unknown function (DUF3991)/Toprim-like
VGDRVSNDEIAKANEVHIIDYLTSKGEPLLKQGKYYRHAEHDSLIINENGMWYWNSHSIGNYGAISFARTFYDMKFQEAVRDINNQEIERTFSKNREQTVKQEFVYPEQYEVHGIENAIDYLVNTRSLDIKIVLALHKHQLIAEDKMKNIVFKWRDKEGNIVGADRQGTVKMDNKRGTFKQILANSKADGGFTLDIGIPKKIALFESPIDALSYFDLKRPNDIRLQSMSGLKDTTVMFAIRNLMVECYERNEHLEKIIFAVDNDKAGKEFSEKWVHIIGQDVLQFDVPIKKDWNLDLQAQRKMERDRSFHQESELQGRTI